MVPEGPVRSQYLTKVSEIGFDGVELGIEALGGLEATERSVLETRKELEDHGTPCVVVRAGGALERPDVEPHHGRRLEKAVDVAHWLGADTVNTALSSPPRDPTAAGALTGQPTSQGSSRMATSEEFERTARVLHEIGEKAGAWGISITVEVHQHSIADNSSSTMRLLELADSPHVFANPDLGNIYWTYEVPEETSEEAIVALAPTPSTGTAKTCTESMLLRSSALSSYAFPCPTARSTTGTPSPRCMTPASTAIWPSRAPPPVIS